ncbi:MAG: hypothetical protein U5L95_00055 [Candidatus Saccharibacteria bacterium]|nr:hypothetical protein [Candidatus Saccharibacteria bacterium]
MTNQTGQKDQKRRKNGRALRLDHWRGRGAKPAVHPKKLKIRHRREKHSLQRIVSIVEDYRAG